MQNRYVADVGDFGKFGLLRYLTGCFDELPSLRLGVIWYRVPDELHNNDGHKIGYLHANTSSVGRFEECDPQLFRKLRAIVSAGRRHLDTIRQGGILPATARFFEEELSFAHISGASACQKRAECRQRWRAAALQATATCDIVFVDPDNGLQCKSIGPHHKLGPKYAFREELVPIIDRGQTLVAYHHICRLRTAEAQIREQLGVLRTWGTASANAFALRFRRGSARAFLIVPSRQHRSLVRRRVGALISSPWNRHFELVEGDTSRGDQLEGFRSGR